MINAFSKVTGKKMNLKNQQPSYKHAEKEIMETLLLITASKYLGIILIQKVKDL